MFMEFQFEDIIFGMFPLVRAEVMYAFGSWPKNSIRDIIDMLLQMLEVLTFTYIMSQFSFIYLKALEFIHDLNIAHCVSNYPTILLIF